MDNKVPPPYHSVYPPMEGPQYYPSGGQPMPMPQPAYVVPPTGPPTTTTNIVITTPGPNFDCESSRMTCPYCRAVIDTKVEKNPSTKAWLSSLAIAFFGSACFCFLGCCLIPCCMDDCMDIKHSCPNCQAFLGERRA